MARAGNPYWWYCLICKRQEQNREDMVQHVLSKHARRETKDEYHARKPIDHGTDAGYHAHRRRRETACPECKKAHAEKARRWTSR